MITHNPFKGKIDHAPDLGGFGPQTIRLTAEDGVSLAAWVFHGEPAPVTVILVHGWCGEKGLMDGQIVFLRRLGWDVVALDLRNHGESGGNVSSMGYHETKDVAAAVAYVRSTPPLSQRIVLWGISMGAAAALRVAADDPSIAGVISESSYLNLRETVWRHGRIYFGPVFSLLTPIVLLVARWRTGMKIDALDVEKSVARIRTAWALFVAGADDERTPPSHAHRLAGLCASPHRRVYIAANGGHAVLFRENAEAYTAEVRLFIEEVIARTGESSFRPPGD